MIKTEEPWEGDRIGRLIREEIKEASATRVSNTTLQLLCIANRSNHVEQIIEPNLKKGNIVVQDRYWMSTVGYGSVYAKDKELYRNYFMEMSRIFPMPDIVFFIDVPPKEAYDRIQRRKKTAERFDKLATLKKLLIEYRELEKAYKGTWINIDGSKSIEEVGKDIMESYMSILSGK